MSLNSLKKMIIFSNDRTRKIIEGMIADEATIEKRSASALIEKHLMDELLPQNQNAAMWIQLLYDGSWEIGDVLQACFAYLSAGIDWKAKHDNAFELVKFAQHWDLMANVNPDSEAQEMYHFLSQLDSVATKLMIIATESVDGEYEAKKEAEWARELYKITFEEPDKIRFGDIYQLVLNNWEFLKNWSITYRLLADMSIMQKNWINTEETRYELTKILKCVSSEWE